MSLLSRTEHVVVVGAGYAGLPCALKLASLRAKHSQYRITLLSKDRKQDLTCELYRSLRWGDSSFLPLESYLSSHINFIEGSCEGIDTVNKSIQLSGATQSEMPYDELIIATGRQADVPPISGLKELLREDEGMDKKIFLFRSPSQVQTLRLTLKRLHWEDSRPRTKDFFLVVLGAGSTGLEVAGELAAMRGKNPTARIILLDEKKELIPDFSPIARKILKKELGKLQIESVLGSRAINVTQNEIFLQNGQVIPWDMMVVCCGSKIPAKFAAVFQKSLAGQDGIKVDGHFRVQNFPNVFALGDIARVPYPSEILQNQRFVPKRAQFAVQEALFLGADLAHFLNTGKWAAEVFSPSDYGHLISLGPGKGIARLGPEIEGKFTKLLSPFSYGPTVNKLKRSAYLRYLLTLKGLKLRQKLRGD